MRVPATAPAAAALMRIRASPDPQLTAPRIVPRLPSTGRRSVRMEVQQEETAYALDNEEYTELRALDTLLARNTGAPNLYIVDREVQRAVNALATDHQRGMNQLDESNDGVWEARASPSCRRPLPPAGLGLANLPGCALRSTGFAETKATATAQQ